jgi:large subunit ribosomal protein L13
LEKIFRYNLIRTEMHKLMSYKTVSIRAQDAPAMRKWYVVDAEGESVGRLCTKIAAALRGKNKPTFTPHVDTGDYIIVLNADKIRFTGKKMAQKKYLTFSLYPGGQKSALAKDILVRKPHYILEEAVKGMLPKTKLGRAMYKKLFLYSGAEHPHAAQQPQPLA